MHQPNIKFFNFVFFLIKNAKYDLIKFYLKFLKILEYRICSKISTPSQYVGCAYFRIIEFFEKLKNVLIKSCPNNTKFLL